MRSLRGRLTLSYAIVVAVVLALLSLFACRVAFEFYAHSAFDALALSVARAETAASADTDSTQKAVERVVAAAAGPGVVVFAPGFHHGRQRHDRSRTTEPPPPPGEPGPPAPTAIDSPLVREVVAPFLGLRPRVVVVRGARVMIAPDVLSIAPLVRRFGWILFGSLAISTALSWAIASRLARFAIAPIVSLTHELERFAAGDFTPRRVASTEQGELGNLVAAYNGAAAQVTSAFQERIEVEAQTRRFLADASHELRTPLTVVVGYLDILRKGGIDDPAVRERALATLTLETRRMRTLVEKLLGLARLEQPGITTPSRVDACEVARAAAARATAARGGEISLECAGPVPVHLDPADLSEAIANVVENAVKYGGGTAVVVAISIDRGRVEIRVGDGGGGIAEGERERIFERFYRGDERAETEGTGLGLAIAERALGRSGGHIILENGAPERTTFLLTVPSAPRFPDTDVAIRLG